MVHFQNHYKNNTTRRTLENYNKTIRHFLLYTVAAYHRNVRYVCNAICSSAAAASSQRHLITADATTKPRTHSFRQPAIGALNANWQSSCPSTTDTHLMLRPTASACTRTSTVTRKKRIAHVEDTRRKNILKKRRLEKHEYASKIPIHIIKYYSRLSVLLSLIFMRMQVVCCRLLNVLIVQVNNMFFFNCDVF